MELNGEFGVGGESHARAVGQIKLAGGAERLEFAAGQNVAAARVIGAIDSESTSRPCDRRSVRGGESRRRTGVGYQKSAGQIEGSEAGEGKEKFVLHGLCPRSLIGEGRRGFKKSIYFFTLLPGPFESDQKSVSRLQRLPVLFCWLLCLYGAAASSGEAWVRWLGAPNSLKLADLDPEHETTHLAKALEAEPRNLSALLRLSLHAEFSGDLARAETMLGDARRYHHSYQSYMASLSYASRRKRPEQVKEYAELALRYCPGDADGVYVLLGPVKAAAAVIPEARQADYLRHLIGQERLEDALFYQRSLAGSEVVERQRLALGERLILNGQIEAAAELLKPDYDMRFEREPRSLGFDWRLSRNPVASIHWRAGELEVAVGETRAAIEVASVFVAAVGKRRVAASWTGETRGLSWTVAEPRPGWLRVGLVAPAGPTRRFTLREARLE